MSESESLGANEPTAAHIDVPMPGPAIPDAGVEPVKPPAGPGAEGEVEVVDGLPVLAEVRTVERPSPAPLPVVQVAAVAATGFVAGAATVVLVKRLSHRKLAGGVRRGPRRMVATRSGPRRPVDLLPIAASRSFLVDVHVIAKPE